MAPTAKRFILVGALVVGAMTVLGVTVPYALVAISYRYQVEGFRTDLAALVTPHSPAVSLNECELFNDDFLAPAGTCLARANAAQMTALETGLHLTRRGPHSLGLPSEPDGCIARPGFGGPDIEVLFGDRTQYAANPFNSPLMVFVDRASGTVCFEARYGWG